MKNYRIRKVKKEEAAFERDGIGYAYKKSYLKQAYDKYKKDMKKEMEKGREVEIYDRKTFDAAMNEALTIKQTGALGNKTPLQVIKKNSYIFENKWKQNKLKKALGIPKSQKLGMDGQQLHKLFSQKIASGEWYVVNGNVYSTVDNSWVY